MKRLAKWIATLGPIGYLPAPGTMGTLATLPLVYGLSMLSLKVQLLAIAFVVMISFFVIQQALTFFKVADPSHIVLDEVIGCLITFVGVACTVQSLFAGFMLFRFFDIAKPFGIKKVEKLPGAWGVLLDDCVAGLCANVVLQILMQC